MNFLFILRKSQGLDTKKIKLGKYFNEFQFHLNLTRVESKILFRDHGRKNTQTKINYGF